MGIIEQKADLRTQCAQTRRAEHAVCDQGPAQAFLVSYVEAIPAVEIVSGYWPIRSEIDPRPAMTSLHEQGFQMCLPVVTGPGEVLEFRVWHPDMAMIKSGFGVLVPEVREVIEPEALIVPLLAFDKNGHRLGYGGGFYDRTLAMLRAKRRSYGIGFAFAGQIRNSVPSGPHDQHLDAIVTETGTVLPS